MLLPLLVVAAVAAAGPPGDRGPAPPDNLLRGPARCVLRYLEAVRLAGPRSQDLRRQRLAVREKDYEPVRRLTAPRALEDIAVHAAHGLHHPLAPWQDAARGRVLESFQLLSVRRAPRGAAVVTVRERLWDTSRADALVPVVSEYLVARVDGDWRIVDRRPGAAFDDAGIAGGYAGWFDDPSTPDAPPRAAARTGALPGRSQRSRETALPR